MIDVLVHDKACSSQLYANLCYYVMNATDAAALFEVCDICVPALALTGTWSCLPQLLLDGKGFMPSSFKAATTALLGHGFSAQPGRVICVIAWHLHEKLSMLVWLRLSRSSLIRLLRFHLLRQVGMGSVENRPCQKIV